MLKLKIMIEKLDKRIKYKSLILIELNIKGKKTPKIIITIKIKIRNFNDFGKPFLLLYVN